jgi:hypothetical protein
MAPRKKQRTQQQPTTQSLDGVTPFDTLNDDVLGMLYASLEDGKDRASFRHSCAACYR